MRWSGGIDLDCSTLPRNTGTDSAATSDPLPVTLAPNLNAGFDGSEPAISRFSASYAAIRNGSPSRRLLEDRLERLVVRGPRRPSRLWTSDRIASCVAVVWAAVWSARR